jgi:hypothetical protein
MLRNLGEPDVIGRGPWRTYMEWPPIYPGVPIREQPTPAALEARKQYRAD